MLIISHRLKIIINLGIKVDGDSIINFSLELNIFKFTFLDIYADKKFQNLIGKFSFEKIGQHCNFESTYFTTDFFTTTHTLNIIHFGEIQFPIMTSDTFHLSNNSPPPQIFKNIRIS